MKNQKLSFVFKSLSLIFGVFLLFLIFIMGGFILGEGYNMFNPYADTEFAKDYSPEKFKMVQAGMTMKEIKMITGEPLNSVYDTAKVMIYHSYTRDGYIRRNPDVNFALTGDLAWYGSSAEYDKDSIAVKVYAGWHYD
ncbi:MAG: hypothetical protein HOP31_03235 [Ignavibacteria bacterium]|nr:hypothetical protein [Ignavibacteria bacterium]